MNIETFIAELKSDFYKYDNMGLIDELSVYKWVYNSLRPFGGLISDLRETTLYTRNGRADLPQNFFSISYAIRCTPYYLKPVKSDDVEYPYIEIGRVEREHHGFKWLSCNECCVEECKDVITEKIFIGRSEIEYHYKDPKPLRLGEHIDSSKCSPNCRNNFSKTSDNEVSIKGNTLFANFDDAIFMRYKALPSDDNDLPYIPETDLGFLYQYVDYYVKTAILEKVVMNSEEQEGASKLQYMRQNRDFMYRQAMGEVKMMNFGRGAYEKVARDNRRRMYLMSGGVDFSGNTNKIKLL